MPQNDFPEFDPTIAEMYGQEGFTGPDIMGIPVLDSESLIQMMIRFAFNLLICWIIVKFFYYKKSGRRDFYFTFIAFSVTVFLLIYLLDSVRLQIGMALGLFAIFGIIRYRTEQVSIREMTYLFVTIGISVINGLSKTLSLAELVVANLLFIVVISIMENAKIVKHIATKIVLYERIDMIVPEKSEELKADLEQRIGINIIKLEVGHVDFLRDVAFIKVYYHPLKNEVNTIDTVVKLNDFS